MANPVAKGGSYGPETAGGSFLIIRIWGKENCLEMFQKMSWKSLPVPEGGWVLHRTLMIKISTIQLTDNWLPVSTVQSSSPFLVHAVLSINWGLLLSRYLLPTYFSVHCRTQPFWSSFLDDSSSWLPSPLNLHITYCLLFLCPKFISQSMIMPTLYVDLDCIIILCCFL